MIINTKSLLDELISKRSKFKSETAILDEVKLILNENRIDREQIENHLKSKSSTIANNFEFDLLETENIFHIEQIKTISIDYRLRFLDSHLFKNEIPEEAISKIRFLEKTHRTTLQGFKIIAPSKTFQLQNYDDPLLFAPIGNNYFYLIHKWGNDLHPLRKISVLPFKNLMNFVIFCGVISFLITYFTPLDSLSKEVPLAQFILFLFMFKAIIASFSYYFFLSGKNFNSEIWNRKFKEN